MIKVHFVNLDLRLALVHWRMAWGGEADCMIFPGEKGVFFKNSAFYIGGVHEGLGPPK